MTCAVHDVVRDVVTEIAPEELPVVAGLAALDEVTVRRRLHGDGGRQEPLGFGLGEVVALVTPVVWITVDQVANRLAGSAVDGATKGAKAVLRRVFRRNRAGTPLVVPRLTAEQLAEVREVVLANAARRGLTPEQAEAIADAVTARLAMDKAEKGDPDADEGPSAS